LALVVIVAAPLGIAAQCDADKINKATAGANGYRRIDDTLCEGIFGKDVSGNVLTFVSLTEPMFLDTYEPLHIGWAAPPGDFHMRAQSWAEQAFQMDALVAEGTTMAWPLDLLRNENIPLESVGLLGWVEAGQTNLYVPLRVSTQRDSEPDTQYVFQILPNARLRSVAVTLAAVGAAGERPSSGYIRNEEVIPQTRFTTSEAVKIGIPQAELPSPGIYFMEVIARQADDSTPDTETLWFYHGSTP
jgi:hypothetical protein